MALLVTVAGALIAVSGSGSTARGPAAVVLRYFADLQRGDAAAAVAAGRLPAGRRTFLTDQVLAEQQGIAVIRSVAVTHLTQRGRHAVVRVRYGLGPRTVHAAIRLHQRDGRWLLDRVAVPVIVHVAPARNRAVLAGRPVPDGPVLLFPGAVPVTFDTAFVTSDAASVGFASAPDIRVRAGVSRRGRHAAVAALEQALRDCLVTPAPDCPQPEGRVVPGTVRSGLLSQPRGHVRVTLAPSPAGVVDLRERVRAQLQFHRLDFRDRPHSVSGTFALLMHARAYATAPLHVVWRPW
jgi:hypothetical protein